MDNINHLLFGIILPDCDRTLYKTNISDLATGPDPNYIIKRKIGIDNSLLEKESISQQ